MLSMGLIGFSDETRRGVAFALVHAMARAHRSKASTGGARSIDRASLVFGLVAIPVRIISSAEHGGEVHFHMVHAGCGQRLKQQYVCPKHGPVERGDIAKGYAVDKTSTVEMSKAELAETAEQASDEIALVEFVPASAVDLVWLDRTYYLGPDRGGAHAYALLRAALESTELVGIARYAARGKQYLVMIRPFETGLVMHQLRYADQVKPWSIVGVEKRERPSANELALAEQLIGQRKKSTFEPGTFADAAKARVRALVAKKAKHGDAVEQGAGEAATPTHQVPDLMAALAASLGAKPHASPARSHAKPHRVARHAPAARTRARPRHAHAH